MFEPRPAYYSEHGVYFDESKNCYFERISVDGASRIVPWAYMTVRVDLDGFLTVDAEVKDHRKYALAVPNKQAIEFVNALRKAGFYIIVHTARFEQDRGVTEIWLRQNQVDFNEVIAEKPRCFMEIDDLHPDYTGEFSKYLAKALSHKKQVLSERGKNV